MLRRDGFFARQVAAGPARSYGPKLFGFDMLLDADAHPWLIEVQAKPAAVGLGPGQSASTASSTRPSSGWATRSPAQRRSMTPEQIQRTASPDPRGADGPRAGDRDRPERQVQAVDPRLKLPRAGGRIAGSLRLGRRSSSPVAGDTRRWKAGASAQVTSKSYQLWLLAQVPQVQRPARRGEPGAGTMRGQRLQIGLGARLVRSDGRSGRHCAAG